ncbi:MAG: sigma-54 interaction domain-containing protein, partial [Bythopirellula sp.]
MDVNPKGAEKARMAALPDHNRELLMQRLANTIDQVFWFSAVEPERVLYVSPAYERLWGRTSEELYEGSRVWVEAIHPDDQQPTTDSFVQWLEGKIPEYRVEYRIVRPDGSIRWISDSGAKIPDAQGNLKYISGIAKDITEEKEARLALENAVAEITKLKERLDRENTYLREEIESSLGSDEIIGQSDPLRVTLGKVEQVAMTDSTVLLLGETGTGKELLARAIHGHSRRKDRPIVKVDCASLPSSLIESELFGHAKGAFTGAVSEQLGRFHLADKGTIFLDEIGELHLAVQSKLLRVLQEGEFQTVGSPKITKVDVRIVAATNRDLHAAVKEGLFRSELYYRLAVFPIEVPPLRLRREDIPLLVHHFIKHKKARLAKWIKQVPEHVMSRLVDYDWPGNVRELENVIERAMILSPGDILQLDESLAAATKEESYGTSSSSLEEVDYAHIVSVLQACNWTIKGQGKA